MKRVLPFSFVFCCLHRLRAIRAFVLPSRAGVGSASEQADRAVKRFGERVEEVRHRRAQTVLLDPKAAPKIRDFADRSSARNPRGGFISAVARAQQKKALKSARRHILGLTRDLTTGDERTGSIRMIVDHECVHT